MSAQVINVANLKSAAEVFASSRAAFAKKRQEEEDDRDSNSDTASSIGCDDSIVPFVPLVKHSTYKAAPVVLASVSPKTAVKPAEKKPEALPTVLAHAMTFLPFETIQTMRKVSPAFEAAASLVAPQPIEGADGVVFMRWTPTADSVPVAHSRSFSWRCLECHHLSTGPRVCQTCHAPIGLSACRVFFGQLRKDLTVELVSYMLRSLCPEMNVLHIESHTNPNDGRGKGCAWVYVDSVADAQKLVALHKRVFVDADADGFEGFWVVPQEHAAQLGNMANAIGCSRSRPTILPRQPIVAELPAKSLIARIVDGTLPQSW